MTSKYTEKYGIGITRINELCLAYKVRPITKYSDNFIDSDGNVYQLDFDKDKFDYKMTKSTPVEYLKKTNIPVYYVRERFANGKGSKINAVKLYLYTYYGEMPDESIRYKKDLLINEYKYHINHINTIDEDSIIVNDVLFKRVYIDGTIKSEYFVSENGVIYHNKYNRFIRHGVIAKFYETVNLSTQTVLLHRLVYNTWKNKKPWLPPDIQIDHIDGYKNHNWLSNLRESTNLDNFRSAIFNQNLRNTVYTVEEIHKICALLQSNQYSPKEITEIIKHPYESVRHTIKDLLAGKMWKDITSQYDFSAYKSQIHGDRVPTSDEVIHEICRLYSEEHLTREEIANQLNVGITVVRTVIRGENRLDISSQYPGLPDPEKKKLTKENATELCEMIMQGHPIEEVANAFDISPRHVKDIIRRTRRPNLGKYYHFELLYPDFDYTIPYEADKQVITLV